MNKDELIKQKTTKTIPVISLAPREEKINDMVNDLIELVKLDTQTPDSLKQLADLMVANEFSNLAEYRRNQFAPLLEALLWKIDDYPAKTDDNPTNFL